MKTQKLYYYNKFYFVSVENLLDKKIVQVFTRAKDKNFFYKQT